MDDVFKMSHHLLEVLAGFVDMREGQVCTILNYWWGCKCWHSCHLIFSFRIVRINQRKSE